MQTVDEALSVLLWIGFTAPLIALWVAGFWDLAHRSDLSVFRKAVWGALFVLTLYVGIAIYFVTRPVRPPAGKGTSQTAPRASRIVSELESLSVSRSANELTDDEFLDRKRELLGL